MLTVGLNALLPGEVIRKANLKSLENATIVLTGDTPIVYGEEDFCLSTAEVNEAFKYIGNIIFGVAIAFGAILLVFNTVIPLANVMRFNFSVQGETGIRFGSVLHIYAVSQQPKRVQQLFIVYAWLALILPFLGVLVATVVPELDSPPPEQKFLMALIAFHIFSQLIHEAKEKTVWKIQDDKYNEANNLVVEIGWPFAVSYAFENIENEILHYGLKGSQSASSSVTYIKGDRDMLVGLLELKDEEEIADNSGVVKTKDRAVKPATA